MAHTTPHTWNTYYADGGAFRPLGDAERRLLAQHAPAPDGALALDVGCGLGELARHLAAAGYTVDAVDHSDTALARAHTDTAPDTPVTYLLHDIEHDDTGGLPHPAYDLITCRLSWAFIHDRTRVLHRLRERLRPGGTLCVITPVPSAVPDDKRGIALDEEEIGLLSEGWKVADRHDANGLAFLVLREPIPQTVRCAAKGRPSPHALTGAGVVVTDSRGRILLGWSTRREVWELPGGKNDADEDFVAAGVRELEEETGLVADLEDARLLALLMDSVHGIPRLTAAVHVPAFSGEPAVREPDLIRRWEWMEPADLPHLPQPLFTPSAHVINTVRPGLLPDLPPVHRYPIIATAAPAPAEQAAGADELRQTMPDR
ncbi:MAG: NUDIX domain-containing protein [Streptomyces sp.]|nr:NUDIX domain-containing protein [Streptomyces sp.]